MTTTSTARARATDPETSHAAARSVEGITATQTFIVKALLRQPAHDQELIARYRNMTGAPAASESGIRSRRAELVDRRIIEPTGQTIRLDSGRYSIVWRLNPDNPFVQLITEGQHQ